MAAMGAPGVVVVLNGASSAGKSTVAAALRERWRRPLQVSGIDTFLACQAESFFGVDGSSAPGLTWTATTVHGAPAYEVTPGPLGATLVQAAHRYWRACAEGGLDQVVDHVLLQRDWALDLQSVMTDMTVIWVAVSCPVAVLEQRERDRGDRKVGQARGHAHLVHRWLPHDIEIDTSLNSPTQAASCVIDAVVRRTGLAAGDDGLWPAA